MFMLGFCCCLAEEIFEIAAAWKPKFSMKSMF